MTEIMQDVMDETADCYKSEKVDHWSTELPGDCENIALNRYFRLKEKGFDTAKMWIAIVDVIGLVEHAVLIVKLPDGHYCLDNRNTKPVRWNIDNAGYFNWKWMWPIESGKGWTIWSSVKNRFMKTGKRQNVNPPPQLVEFRKTLTP